MQEKGVVTAADFAREASKGAIAGAPKDLGLALQKPAQALLAMPLCPHVVDDKGIVLSVHPMSNGYQTRTTADAKSAILLEATSNESEAVCRQMLLALIKDAIEIVEQGGGEGREDSQATRERRRVRLLVEPVDVVCHWDRKL